MKLLLTQITRAVCSRNQNQSIENLQYFQASNWQHFKSRVTWIVLLSAVGLVSGVILHTYENALERLIILALYMPMIADTGGNVGSQSATIIVRALALGEVQVSDILRVLGKELVISILLAIVLGFCAYAKVLLLSNPSDIPAGFSLSKIALMISFALSLQVITSTVIGAIVPLVANRYGYDPANVATPALTTIVDITGLVIFFSLANRMLAVF